MDDTVWADDVWAALVWANGVWAARAVLSTATRRRPAAAIQFLRLAAG